MISENVQIKIVPDGFDSYLYYASVSLEPDIKLPYFLTIIASPDAIPMYRESTIEDDCGAAGRVEAE